MGKTSTFVIAILCFISFIAFTNAQSKAIDRTYKLRVESVVDSKQSIPFLFVYSQGDNKTKSAIISIEKVTPFEMEITSEMFTSLIQDKELKGQVKVTVTTIEDGKQKGIAESKFPLNLIRIFKDEIGVYSY